MLTQMRRSPAALSCCTVQSALRAHHDRLLRVDTDLDSMLDLFELAVTWGELDYSEAPVLAPVLWLDFARDHHWRFPERAERIFSLATDVAFRARPAAARDELGDAGARRVSLRSVISEVMADVVAI
jgi:hypothetical protein